MASDGPQFGTAVVTINVNSTPVAGGNGFQTDEDGTLTVGGNGVLGDDTDGDSDAVIAVNFTQPAHGTLTFGTDGTFTYTPTANFNGEDGFTYRASDGLSSSAGDGDDYGHAGQRCADRGQRLIHVADHALSLLRRACWATTAMWMVHVLTAAGDRTGAREVVLGTTAVYLYAEPGFHGVDRFTYRASDGNLVATVTLTITGESRAGGRATLTPRRKIRR